MTAPISSRAFLRKLVQLGVRPYYLFQLDDVLGATHFKVRLDTGIRDNALFEKIRLRPRSPLLCPRYNGGPR